MHKYTKLINAINKTKNNNGKYLIEDLARELDYKKYDNLIREKVIEQLELLYEGIIEIKNGNKRELYRICSEYSIKNNYATINFNNEALAILDSEQPYVIS